MATLYDAYFGFITFFCWLAWRERSLGIKIIWFVLIMTLGNIAMSAYCLSELFTLPKDGRLADLLAVRRTGPGTLGLILAAVGALVVALA